MNFDPPDYTWTSDDLNYESDGPNTPKREGGADGPSDSKKAFTTSSYQGHHVGGRRGTGAAKIIQQPVPVMAPPQVISRGRMFQYPSVPYNVGGVVAKEDGALPQPSSIAASAKALANAPANQQISVIPRGRMFQYPSVPYIVGGAVAKEDGALPPPSSTLALASGLANAPADQQRSLLGKHQYLLVNLLALVSSAKLTEMDQSEVLHLLESPDSLKAKVADATNVLRNVRPQQDNTAVPDAQFAALSLNENVAC